MTIEAIKAAHQENRKAITGERDRTLKDPRGEPTPDTLGQVLDTLNRIEAILEKLCPLSA